MSADNYYYVFKRDGKYVVKCRFASFDYEEKDDLEGGKEFDTFDEADRYAREEYSEYGVIYGFPVRTVET